MNDAKLSADRTYRYELTRRVDLLTDRLVLFVMLNPSTADEMADDPTIRRCIDFTRRWECGRLAVVNLFPYRASNPKDLRQHYRRMDMTSDRVRRQGDPRWRSLDENRGHIQRMAAQAEIIVAAWGNHGAFMDRGRGTLEFLRAAGHSVHHLGFTNRGHPRHPLYVPKRVRPVPYEAAP